MKTKRSFYFSLASLSIALVALSPLSTGQKSDAQQQGPAGSTLRDVFLGKENSSLPTRTVGRLAILLKTEDGFKQVPPDYSFHSGDQFRFSITSNQQGYLYILHAAPTGSLKQLWPQAGKDNAIGAHESYEVPASPGVFIFSGDVGQEYFYVSLRSRQTAPDLKPSGTEEKPHPQTGKGQRAQPKKTPPSMTKTNSNNTNFVIRDPFGETDRDVVFKDDLYLYFSSAPQENGKNALLEFQLSHVD